MILIYITCIAIILLTVVLVRHILSEDKRCINNPLIFGIQKFNEANHEEYSCTCYAQNDKDKSFSFDEEDIDRFSIGS